VARGGDGRGDVFDSERLVDGVEDSGFHWAPSGVKFDQGSASLIAPARHLVRC
jgi:hypothetical protein